jgi:DNA-3-methyladenine glycosylase I
LKIASAIANAKAFLNVQKEFGSFNKYIWSFQTLQPDVMSRELKKRGFNFVGPTICYAFMQAVGMVNDHEADCFVARKYS